jgi:abequosyltransferase
MTKTLKAIRSAPDIAESATVHGVPLLSVCIPTYNRARFLSETLEALELCLKRGDNAVEILVSDNASLDETATLLEQWRDRLPSARFFRQPENIGGEGNFYFLMRKASGRYLWILGDDDKISPEILKIFMQKIASDPDAVIFNYSVSSIDFSIVHTESFFQSQEDRQLMSRADVLGFCGIGASFISAVVLKRERILQIEEKDYAQYSPFGLSFLYTVYASFPEKCKVEYVGKPMVYCRGNNSVIDWEKVFLDGVSKVMGALRSLGYPVDSIRRAKAMAIWSYVLQKMSQLKISGAFNVGFVRRSFRAYGDCLDFWYAVLPFSMMPTVGAKFVKKIRARKRTI